jgi:hypothetical protein
MAKKPTAMQGGKARRHETFWRTHPSGLQDAQRQTGQARECARVRRGDGTHQIVDGKRRLRPVDLTIRRPSAAEVGAGRQILRPQTGRAGQHGGQRPVKTDFRRHRHLAEHLDRRIVRQDGDGHLVDDRAVVRLFVHDVQRGAGLALAVQNRPVHRNATAVFGQQRTVQVEGALSRNVQQVFFQHVAVVEGKQEVRPGRRNLGHHLGRVGIVRGDEWNVVIGGEPGDAVEPDAFRRVVVVGDDQGDFHLVGEQHLEAAHADVVVGKDDGATHGVFSSTASTR